ncbi:hypothetical protein L484_000570 [Morus notabilis]|uniref:factor independent urate hydroxylase n=1 Tax=Morus notabilis TaxID=981085 RepID=W9SFD2_9ROSA|nr:hypothetical protein L484_000570 [Morus notabilis]
MANENDGFKFEQRHGKARVRVARVWRNPDGRQSVVEWSVSISLFSDCPNAYFRDDNSDIVATDTMKNTVTILIFIFSISFDLICLFIFVNLFVLIS